MKYSKLLAVGLSVASLNSIQVLAVDAPVAKPPVPVGTLHAETELGVILTTGNTNTASYKAKFLTKYEGLNWKNKFLVDALYKEDEIETNGVTDTQVTAEKYFVSAQSDYKLNVKNSALFVFASYENDRFSGYAYQSTFALGYSDRLFEGESSMLDYSAGPGYSFSETDTGVKDETSMVRVAMAYEYKLSGHAKFNQDLSTEIVADSKSNAKSKSETAITANLLGSLSLKAAYSITHNSEVAADKETTDTTTSISVVYVF